MRIPQSPPSYQQILGDRPEELIAAHGSPRYSDFVANCQRKYQHWDKVRILARGERLDPALAWARIEMVRSVQMRHLPLCGPGKTRLRYMLPDVVQRHLSRIDHRMVRGIDASGPPLTESQRDRVILGALREEAITSSLLEGAATTRREARELLDAGRPPRNRGEQMVYNNFQAIEFIREHTRTDLSPTFLLELHTILTRDTLDRPDEVGRFRAPGERIVVEDVRSGDVLHQPPPAEELDQRLRMLCDFANAGDDTLLDDDHFLHPAIRAITLHFQIGYDHPFCDGNGRTARAMFYWSMLRQGFDLFEYLPISRYIYRGPAAYQRAYQYTETDAFDLTYFLVYHLRIIQEAIDALTGHIQHEREKTRALRAKARPAGISDRQWEALRRLRDSTVDAWTIENYQAVLRVSYGTARSDLYDLDARALVRRVKSGRQFRFLLRT